MPLARFKRTTFLQFDGNTEEAFMPVIRSCKPTVVQGCCTMFVLFPHHHHHYHYYRPRGLRRMEWNMQMTTPERGSIPLHALAFTPVLHDGRRDYVL